MVDQTQRRNRIWTLPIIAVAVAASAVAVGIPLRAIFFAGAVLACPLMMITMMGMGMHGVHKRMNADSTTDEHHGGSHHSCCGPPRR